MSVKMTDEEAIEALTDKDVVNPYLTLEALEIAIDALKERAERKTGKWIEQAVCNSYAYYRCSECGRTETIYYAFGDIPTKERVVEKFPYCHCGAKMEVDKEATDGGRD